jgi:hypothetical protein
VLRNVAKFGGEIRQEVWENRGTIFKKSGKVTSHLTEGKPPSLTQLFNRYRMTMWGK